jgi:hypothetical protein
MITIRVRDFTEFPGPRKETIGSFSGERFRKEEIMPTIIKHGIEKIQIDLDGTAGYGSSFLDEAFGGLIREEGLNPNKVSDLCKRIISDDDPSLISEIMLYVSEAIEELSQKSK